MCSIVVVGVLSQDKSSSSMSRSGKKSPFFLGDPFQLCTCKFVQFRFYSQFYVRLYTQCYANATLYTIAYVVLETSVGRPNTVTFDSWIWKGAATSYPREEHIALAVKETLNHHRHFFQSAASVRIYVPFICFLSALESPFVSERLFQKALRGRLEFRLDECWSSTFAMYYNKITCLRGILIPDGFQIVMRLTPFNNSTFQSL